MLKEWQVVAFDCKPVQMAVVGPLLVKAISEFQNTQGEQVVQLEEFGKSSLFTYLTSYLKLLYYKA